MPKPNCRCRPNRFRDMIPIGLNEGPERQAEATNAVSSWLVHRIPDFTIGCVLDSDCNAPKYLVFKSDLQRESLMFREILEDNPGATEMTFDCDRSPITEHVMPKLQDFLYNGYYAIVESDVVDYPTDIKIATQCITCHNYLRLLCLHKAVFETGRYLRMELLQLIAMDQFARAIDGAQPIVMQAMVREIYTMYPWREPDLHGNAYFIAGFFDFRPHFIIHAVVKQMTQANHEDSEVWTRASSRAQRIWKIATLAPVDHFRELRGLFPKFDQELNRALGVLRDAPHVWAPYLASL